MFLSTYIANLLEIYLSASGQKLFCENDWLCTRHLPLPALTKDVLTVTCSEKFQQERKLYQKYKAGRETSIIQSFSYWDI